MDELVEKLAMAIYSDEPIGVREWQDTPVATAETCRTIARACLSAIEAEGMVIVPRVLTEDMANKGARLRPYMDQEVWERMLAAAPKPSTPSATGK